jgi:hypothetical protein
MVPNLLLLSGKEDALSTICHNLATMQQVDGHYSIFLRNYHDQELSQSSLFS